MEEILGYIERITFQNEENGYTVLQLKIQGRQHLVCVVGILPGVQPGETIRCFGSWKHHVSHGRQFESQRYNVEAPADVIGIKKYLGSGLIKGIGPTFAKRIADKFDTNTLNVIDQEPQRLLEVEGVGRKKLEQIISCWSEQKSIRQVMMFLQSHGISPTYAQKVFKTYGDKSIQILKENPYTLSRDIYGIGFKTADTIAQKLGISFDSIQRIDAGIEYLLNEFANDGHVCYPQKEFLVNAHEVLKVSPLIIQEQINALQHEGRIERFDLLYLNEPTPFLWLKKLFLSEVGIARELRRLKSTKSHLREVNIEKAIEWIQSQLKLNLAEQQKLAIQMALKDKVQIITGGPGTGKSTITKAILGITEKLTDKIILAAPTGRAAKRMTEITGKRASTIHSLLEYSFSGEGFKRSRNNPLEADLIIIDEASMIDTYLMYGLLKAIPDHCRVILIGDINQLPSVGPGNVLSDLIHSKMIPVTSLTEIFRQAAGSKIITAAHSINSGRMPCLANEHTSDFFFMRAEEPSEAVRIILGLVAQRLPRKYNLHPVKDIQVLAPMKKGELGIENLNVQLQQVLNPKEQPTLYRSGRKYMVGDKVMQIRNNYKKKVFNGDVGIISKLDLVNQSMSITFDDDTIEYDFNELDEITLAYAVSVHKYQGSECPCVVMPIHTTHFMMLRRNLIYTGVTRGKLVVLVGTEKALLISVRTDEVKQRFTGLTQALLNYL